MITANISVLQTTALEKILQNPHCCVKEVSYFSFFFVEVHKYGAFGWSSSFKIFDRRMADFNYTVHVLLMIYHDHLKRSKDQFWDSETNLVNIVLHSLCT